MAVSLEPIYDRIAHPDDLLEHPGVERAVQLLVEGPFDEDDLLAYFAGSNSVLTTLSSIALAERADWSDDLADRVIAAFDNGKIRVVPRENSEGNRLDLRRDIGSHYMKAAEIFPDNVKVL